MYLFCAYAYAIILYSILYLYRQELYQGKGLPRAQSYWNREVQRNASIKFSFFTLRIYTVISLNHSA